ncbi:hypothetical protein [Streptomyces sp. CB03911]|uniref:hypothetical protein n=1 Tax=Streptomyces sp. CB03911 TaxID=1804758 RepID=UPI00093D75C0|nr:hypothetical protein [Streptomyces sp. CB03911]OKI16563.1 hypothetical protein A6A07_11180 [Streptomyces sp. CB03911]
MTRAEVLAKAIEWAAKAEDAEATRNHHIREADRNARIKYCEHHVATHRARADDAAAERQTSIDMAAMWTAIAAALPGPQPYIAFTTPEEPTP